MRTERETERASEREGEGERRGMIGASLLLLPVKVSGEPVNMAASVSCGSWGKCVCVRVCCRVDPCVYGCLRVCVWWCTACWCMHTQSGCVCVCVCVSEGEKEGGRGGQQFLSSLWGTCAGAKCPAAHRCLFTGWFTALTGKPHTHTHRHTHTHTQTFYCFKRWDWIIN